MFTYLYSLFSPSFRNDIKYLEVVPLTNNKYYSFVYNIILYLIVSDENTIIITSTVNGALGIRTRRCCNLTVMPTFGIIRNNRYVCTSSSLLEGFQHPSEMTITIWNVNILRTIYACI